MAVLLARGQITIAAIKDGADGAQGPQGKPGKDGVDGKDAVSIIVEDAPLVFDTDDNGIVPVSISKAAKVKVMKGNQNISNKCSNISSRGDLCVNCKCGATQKDGYIEVSVSGSNIAKNGVVIDGVNRGNVSATSGYAVAQLTYNGVTYFAQVPFSANVAKFTGVVAFDNKSYKSQFEEVSKRLDGAVTQDELTQAKSEIKQTAREISLSVSEKSIARRNLLVGSDFRKQTNDFIISNDARIEMNSGYQGTNCIKAIDVTEAGNAHYVGVYWDGSQGGKSVRIEKGKKYILSCYFKTNDINAKLTIEAIYTDKVTNAKRIKRATYITPAEFAPKNVYEWQLCTAVIDTKDAASDYIAFNFWKYCLVDSGQIESYICRPMVEEGNTYNGWTLSDKDYDYVGANLIDNSRTLDVGGNVIEAKGQKALVGDAYELTASGSDDYNTFYRIKGSTFKLNTDYTISFEVRGDAKYMGVYVVYPITNTKFTCYRELQNDAMFEANGDGSTIGYVALVEVKELSKQQRVWGHFRFKDRLPEELYFQFPSNTEQTDVTSWTVTITKPKIEVGAVVTEYTERKSDLVDKASLKKAGIEVKSDEVLLYGDRIRVDNNGQTAAMFIGGKLNADFIDADKIEVKHLWAKSEDGTTKVGYFGNYEIDACKVDDTTYAPLFVGGVTAKDSPFYVTSEGAMYATSGYIGGFNIGTTSIEGSSGVNKVMLTPGFISFDNKSHGIDNIIGANWKYGLDYVGQQIVVEYDHATPSYGGNIGIANLKNIALYVSASGNIDRLSRDSGTVNSAYPCGNHAIFCDKGDFAGFRPCFRIITSSQRLSKYDVFLEIAENWNKHNSITGENTQVVVGSVTLSLPTNPEIGQMYWIIRSTKYSYTLKTTDGTAIYTPSGAVTSVTLTTQNEMACIVYTGYNWRLMWNMGV